MTESPHQPLPPGRVDVHSHLLPGVDDGCQTIDDSLACVRRLKEVGYVGSVCTPHMWPETLPGNTPAHVKPWVQSLQQAIDDAGLDYRVWPGGELRLFDGVIDWMQAHGVPTLAGSRCVLVDYWDRRWPTWAPDVFRWLKTRGYQTILAHPERLPIATEIDAIDKTLRQVEGQGVWLQGNFRCMTGEDGFVADQLVRKLVAENRYRLMALDMHGPDSLESRLDGLALAEAEFGRDAVERLTLQGPRRLIVKAA
jgi:protein-tyrosine phosphatase